MDRFTQYFFKGGFARVVGKRPIGNKRKIVVPKDGAPAHFSREAREQLTALFGEYIIGCGRHVPWSPASPDITPIYFFLCDYMKDVIYLTPVQNVMDLTVRIVQAAAKGPFMQRVVWTASDSGTKCHTFSDLQKTHPTTVVCASFEC